MYQAAVGTGSRRALPGSPAEVGGVTEARLSRRRTACDACQRRCVIDVLVDTLGRTARAESQQRRSDQPVLEAASLAREKYGASKVLLEFARTCRVGAILRPYLEALL
jgi:hypothetical protein